MSRQSQREMAMGQWHGLHCVYPDTTNVLLLRGLDGGQ